MRETFESKEARKAGRRAQGPWTRWYLTACTNTVCEDIGKPIGMLLISLDDGSAITDCRGDNVM